MIAKIEVDAPIDRVFDHFLDKRNFPRWKIGYVGLETISGREGEEGTVTMLNYKKFSMIETIEKKDRPIIYITRYDFMQGGRKKMRHRSTNRFVAMGENRTLVEVYNEILEVNGFFTKLFVTLMSKVGEKQFHDQLQLFKGMVEEVASGAF